MTGDFDRCKSLEELERGAWGEPAYDSFLVTTAHRLRRKPLADFTTEDLRIMIGQQIGLPFLIQLAVERLEVEPLAEGDFYPGDLLKAVLGVGEQFWSVHHDSCQRVRQIMGRIRGSLPWLEEESRKIVHETLANAPAILKA